MPALMADIDTAISKERQSPRPCPDLLIYLADLWNAAEYAADDGRVAEIRAEFAQLGDA
jgi:hypothetical protein